jgi:hypothetical protein
MSPREIGNSPREHQGQATEARTEPVTIRQTQAPILAPGHTYVSVTDKISAIVLTGRTPRGWLIGFSLSFALTMLLMVAIAYLFAVGVGIWGLNIPVAWAFDITNFVWWIGIGHAGTLISAV